MATINRCSPSAAQTGAAILVRGVRRGPAPLALIACGPPRLGLGSEHHRHRPGGRLLPAGRPGDHRGFHRYFTHRAFKADRALRIGLAIAGSLAFQGAIITWVADHRRHHAFSDKEGDPHSPWLFGTAAGRAGPRASGTPTWAGCSTATRPTPRASPPTCSPTATSPASTATSWAGRCSASPRPQLLGGLISWSWWGALTALFWAGLVRIAVLHHVTWSINSICHMIGSRPFTRRDHSTNVWPLAVLSMGESWHNLHHADPTCARHGVHRGQLDISARLIWIFEKLGWAHDVRWPTPRRLARLTADR